MSGLTTKNDVGGQWIRNVRRTRACLVSLVRPGMHVCVCGMQVRASLWRKPLKEASISVSRVWWVESDVWRELWFRSVSNFVETQLMVCFSIFNAMALCGRIAGWHAGWTLTALLEVIRFIRLSVRIVRRQRECHYLLVICHNYVS